MNALQLGAVAALLAAVLGFGSGWTVQGWRAEAAQAEAADQLREAQVQNAARARDAAASLEDARAQVRTEFKTITETVDHVVERPVYRNVCIDADGLRALARAVGASEPPAGQPGGPMPRSTGPR